jgi:hypothetical protein
MCTYSGQKLEWAEAIESKMELVPNPCSWDTQPPVLPDENGFYPVAMPGRT